MDKEFDDLFKQVFGKKKFKSDEVRQEVERNADFVLEFGTHRGSKLRDVPLNYLKETGLAWSNKMTRGRAEVEIVRRAQAKGAR